jgi:hypothetical protein
MSDDMGSGDVGGGSSGGDSGGGGSSGSNFVADSADATASGGSRSPGSGDDKGQAAAGGEPKQPKPQKYKLRRDGKDVEATVEELQSWVSDDYAEEIDFGGQKERMTRADLRRHASMGHGAMRKMQEAAALRKKYDGERDEWLNSHENYFSAWAQKQPPGTVPAGMSPTDHFAMRHVQGMAELEELMTKDPRAYATKMLEREAGERDRQAKFKGEREAQQKQMQETQARQRQLFQAIPGAMKDLGLPNNRITSGLVQRVLNEMQQAEIAPNPVQVAQYAKDYYMRDLRSALSGLDGDALEALLGDAPLKAWNSAQVKKLKAAESAAQRKSSGNAPASNGNTHTPRSGEKREVSVNDLKF